MADRKPFLTIPPPNVELNDLLQRSKDHVVTEEELREQRVSFVYGNALHLNGITKDSVRESVERIRLRS